MKKDPVVIRLIALMVLVYILLAMFTAFVG